MDVSVWWMFVEGRRAVLRRLRAGDTPPMATLSPDAQAIPSTKNLFEHPE